VEEVSSGCIQQKATVRINSGKLMLASKPRAKRTYRFIQWTSERECQIRYS